MSTQTESIPCAFCHGKGTDPYDQLSALSTCTACNGQGRVEAPVPNIRCVYCQGTGSYKTYRCPVCGGLGVVSPLPGPSQQCPSCAGRSYDNSSGMYCERCKGRGQVLIDESAERSRTMVPGA
jgi:DnaJ-class molecular chaperone